MFIYYNPNPERRTTRDCVIRAISKITGYDWERTYIGICLQGLLMHDMPDNNYVWSEYLYHQGFIRTPIPDTCPNCTTVRTFCESHPEGSYILAIEGHVVAVIDGNYFDTWDSGDEIPIYYWKGAL